MALFFVITSILLVVLALFLWLLMSHGIDDEITVPVAIFIAVILISNVVASISDLINETKEAAISGTNNCDEKAEATEQPQELKF